MFTDLSGRSALSAAADGNRMFLPIATTAVVRQFGVRKRGAATQRANSSGRYAGPHGGAPERPNRPEHTVK